MSLMGNSAHATVTSVTDAVNQITADSQLLSGWINDQMKRTIPFNSTAGNAVPRQLKIFGIEVGAEAVVTGTKVDTDGFHSLGTTVVDTSKINVYDRLPFPMIMGQAKVGLPFGLDAGVRVGGLPSKSYDHGTTHLDVSNSVVGLDVRKKLIDEGELHPFGLTLGASFTHAKGHLTASSPYSTNTSGVTLTDAFGSARTDWNTRSLGAELLMNKKILFMNPYIGGAAYKNWGTMDTTISNTGTATFSGVSQTITTQATTDGDANTADFRGLAGIEFTFLPFCNLDIGGEYGSESRLAGNIGLRIQFR